MSEEYTLRQLYTSHKGKASDKWSLYLDEYDNLFRDWRDRAVRLLEIGIQNGGSLEIWSRFFPNAEVILGCDIDPKCGLLRFDDQRISTVVDNVNTTSAEKKIIEKSKFFDIIIDDGSHKSSDVIRSFVQYFSHLSDGGIFIVEDMHCSYWESFEGGIRHPYSSMKFFQNLTDFLNGEHWGKDRDENVTFLFGDLVALLGLKIDSEIFAHIHSITFVNSMCIVRKKDASENRLGVRIRAGDVADVDTRTLEIPKRGL